MNDDHHKPQNVANEGSEFAACVKFGNSTPTSKEKFKLKRTQCRVNERHENNIEI